jgi:hypothetical protein
MILFNSRFRQNVGVVHPGPETEEYRCLLSAQPKKRVNLLDTIRGSTCWERKWLSTCQELVLVPLPWVFYTHITYLKVCLSLQRSLPARRSI